MSNCLEILKLTASIDILDALDESNIKLARDTYLG